jgi:2-dehydropantoate 2-reductase
MMMHSLAFRRFVPRTMRGMATTPFMMTEPITILGAGSMGLLLAARIRLSFPSYPVRVLMRQEPPEKVITVSLREEKQEGSRRAPRLVSVPVGGCQREQRIGNLIVLTKAYDAVSAIKSVGHRLDSNSDILLMCNGAIAVQEELYQCDELQFSPAEMLGNCESTAVGPRVHLGWTTNGAYRESDEDMHHVVQAGFGETALELWPEVAFLFTQSGFKCASKKSPIMRRQLWMKLAANCAINPLTAISNCTNGQVDIERVNSVISEVVAGEY